MYFKEILKAHEQALLMCQQMGKMFNKFNRWLNKQFWVELSLKIGHVSASGEGAGNLGGLTGIS